MKERIFAIIRKEFLHIIKDPRTLYVVIGIPVIQLILFGYALTFDVKHIPTAFYDLDKTPKSRAIINKFKASGYFEIKKYLENKKEIREVLDSGRIRTVVVIPPGFEKKLEKGEKVKLQVLVDGSDPNIGRFASGYATAILEIYSNQLKLQFLEKNGLRLVKGFPPYEDRRRAWYNEELKSVNYIIPGVIAVLLIYIPTILTATAIVREKEFATLEHIIVSPVKSYELMVGKIFPYFVIGVIDASLITLFGKLWFGVPIRGSLLILSLSTMLYLLCNLGTGLFVSTIAQSQQVASTIAFLTAMLPGYLLSGFIFPVESMPKFAQLVSYLVPTRYYLVVIRGIFLKGVGLKTLWDQILVLFVFSFLIITLSTWQFIRRSSQ